MKCDALGNEIKEGDLLAYGTREENVGKLHLGLLTSLDRLQVKVLRKKEDGLWYVGSHGFLGKDSIFIKVFDNQIKARQLRFLVKSLC